MVLNKGDMGEGGSRSSELHVGRELHVSHNCAGMGSVIGERGPGSNVGFGGGAETVPGLATGQQWTMISK